MMYEELTGLEHGIMSAIDKVRAKHDLPNAVVLGVLDVCKGITMDNALHPAETEPVRTIVPDDEGPGMTIVEKNLEPE
ncbi:MAG: hypothetical protein JXA96_17305 [Sedimentisphaerales bacterium]|nr:hypothetical protein [Sedimentisphaerales bacterium]